MVRFDPTALDRAFEVPARQVADGVVPWAVLGVADADDVVRLEAFPGPGTRGVSVDTICLLASITKPIVATVVLQLVAEGRLTLTEPIERILPEAAGLGEPPISAWHLLSHTSGLADVDSLDLLSRGASHEEAVAALLTQPRVSTPGAAFRYATATFDLLASMIARLDGRPYPEALRARLLDPLAMPDTTFDPRILPPQRVVFPLRPPAVGGGPVPIEIASAFISMAMPGAGLWGTAPDLLRFGRAMLRGGELDGARVLPKRFVERMTREATVGGLGETGDPVTADHYALGWGKPGVASLGSPEAFGHGGITGTRLWVDPAADLVFVYLTGVWDLPFEVSEAALNGVYAALG